MQPYLSANESNLGKMRGGTSARAREWELFPTLPYISTAGVYSSGYPIES